MELTRWRAVLSVASILLVFCVVQAVRRPAASDGAPRIEVGEGCVPAAENGADARFQKAMANVEANSVPAASELQQRQWEAAQEAQRVKQREAAGELQRRQQEATRPLSEERQVRHPNSGAPCQFRSRIEYGVTEVLVAEVLRADSRNPTGAIPYFASLPS